MNRFTPVDTGLPKNRMHYPAVYGYEFIIFFLLYIHL